jgi:pimeloyl-ACP methyl ester carboxylesterase
MCLTEDRRRVCLHSLLLTGNKDQFVNLESVVKSTEYVQNFSLKIVEGAGHFPHQELPDTVNNMLLTFLIGE